MAGVDKTYARSFKEYVELREWMKDKVITFPTGQKIIVINQLWELEESDFGPEGGEYAVMSTPHWFDVYLIQNCPVEFVQNRMKEVYSYSYEELKALKFPPSIPDNFKQNRKIKIIKHPVKGRFRLTNNGLNCHNYFWLSEDWDNPNRLYFDSRFKVWVTEMFPHDTFSSRHKTIKSLIRFLRKQYLPSGITFTLWGVFPGEKFLVKII